MPVLQPVSIAALPSVTVREARESIGVPLIAPVATRPVTTQVVPSSGALECCRLMSASSHAIIVDAIAPTSRTPSVIV